MLLLRIIGRPYAYSVTQTDELPRPIVLDSDDQRLVIPWFSPLYALPLRSDDEFGQSTPPASLDDDYSYFTGGLSPVLFGQLLFHTDEVSTQATAVLDDDSTWHQVPYQTLVFRQPIGTTDELSIAATAIIEEDFPWNQSFWSAASFRQPASDTDEVSVPILLEDDLAWLPPVWSAISFAQPYRDTDEVSTSVVTIVDEDPWAQVRWQTLYCAQPPSDTDEVSVPRILDDEFWFQGFSKYLGDRVFAQPYGDGVSFHFIPPVISGNPASLLLDMSMMRLGGRAF